MLLTYFEINKIKRILFISLVCSIGLAVLFLIGKGKFDHLKYVLPGGFVVGLPLGIFEEFIFAVRLKNFSWQLIFVIKIVMYLFLVALLILSSLYFSVLLGIMKLPRFYKFIFNGEFLNSIIFFIVYPINANLAREFCKRYDFSNRILGFYLPLKYNFITFSKNYFLKIVNSTRLFFSRPQSSSFVSIGFVSP